MNRKYMDIGEMVWKRKPMVWEIKLKIKLKYLLT